MTGEAIPVYARAYSASSSRSLYPEASCHRGKLPVNGRHPSDPAACTPADFGAGSKRTMYAYSSSMCPTCADGHKPTPVTETFMAPTSKPHPHDESVEMHNLQLPMPRLLWLNSITTVKVRTGIPRWSVNRDHPSSRARLLRHVADRM